MENKFETILTNSLTIEKKTILKEKTKIIIEQFYKALLNSKDAMLMANEIDIKKQNGFKLNFDIIDNIFKLIEKENIYCGDVIYNERNIEKNFIYSKYLTGKGLILIINEGNTYTLIEMILKNLKANNTVIFNTNGYMYGTNNFLIEIIQTILEKNSFSKNQIQLYISNSYEETLKHYSNIDLVIGIGNHNLQQFVQNHCKNELILSGYENFDIYIESNKHLELINKIIKQNVPIQFYLNKSLNIEELNAIIVDDIEEAVAQINFNGNKYSTAIFTENKMSAMYFVSNIQSKIVSINTSPTLERVCDIKQQWLMSEKTVIYPVGKIEDTIKFDIDELVGIGRKI